MNKLQGGCHCQNVRFEIEVQEQPKLDACNCSICLKAGFLHLIVPKSKFRLLTDEQELSCYQFNSMVAKHYFCKTCGIKSFYVPRSNPDGVSINARCLDTSDWQKWQIDAFDGQDWEANAGRLAHLSKE